MNTGRSLKNMLMENVTCKAVLPYERFMQCGAESLTEEELLAIIIRTGTAHTTPVEIAQKVIALGSGQEQGLNSLYHVSVKDLMKIEGIGEVKAVKLKCIAELSRRMASACTRQKLSFLQPQTIALHYMEKMRHEERELVLLLSLNNRLQLLDEKVLSIGTVNSSLVSSREVFIHALAHGAVNIMILHNHPGGDPTPSSADLSVTDKLKKAGSLLDVNLIDHIIIGDHTYISFKEKETYIGGNSILSNNVFGIDLGTSSIKIYNKATDSIMVEKNMIAIQNKTTIFAYGDSAYEMYEKAPSTIKISSPLNNGVIADINHMETLVKLFITDQMKGNLKPVDFYIAVPTDVTQVEKRAFNDLIRESNVKAKKIMVVEKAIADGLGMNVDVMNSQGVLVVNVGYDTTEISILSLRGIVLSKLIKVGGRKFDDSIRSQIRKEYSLIVGNKTAENVKISLRDLEKENKGALVYGRDIVTGLPVEREIPADIINNALVENFDTILDNIKATLERTPPELAADIYKHGLYLTGGASQVCHLAQRLSNGVGLNVNLSENPVNSVAIGLSKIIKDDQYKTLAYDIEGMSK